MMDAGANAPSVTYEIDGEQYISIYVAGNALAGTKHGDKVYTFKLGGALQEGQVIDASAKGKATKVETEVTVSVDTGLTSYKNSCIACHGDQGANGHNGPNLQNSTVAENKEEVIDRIINGKGAMPSFKDTLTAEEIDAIAEYVATVISPLGDK
ncbi:c-type cytochrome [Psychrobacillus sp. FSL K6-1415]